MNVFFFFLHSTFNHKEKGFSSNLWVRGRVTIREKRYQTLQAIFLCQSCPAVLRSAGSWVDSDEEYHWVKSMALKFDRFNILDRAMAFQNFQAQVLLAIEEN